MLVLAVLAVVGATACASARGQAGPAGPSPNRTRQQKPVLLTVTNQNFADVDVYAYVGDTRERLTMVRSMNTVRLPLPVNAIIDGNVQLVVDPIGGLNPFTTDPIVVNPGETIRLTVAQALPMSNWTVD
ncbi:MAG: hypothetical protein P8099_14185 [Gemmatimonadota bacterium]